MKRGFTLIELLVVTSIIGILSSTVLTSLNGAKIKARNSQRNSQIIEYGKALTLYRDHNGKSPGSEGFWYCLGPSPCSVDVLNPPLHESDGDAPRQVLQPYLPTSTTIGQPFTVDGVTYTGAYYQPGYQLNPPGALIYWALEGGGATCAKFPEEQSANVPVAPSDMMGPKVTICSVIW
jgi:prepilin-type N-terminal cleavage/methylation domain-containing protein